MNSRKLRLLFIIDYLEVGGVSSSLVSLLRAIDAEKFTIDLLIVRGEQNILAQIPAYVRINRLQKLSNWRKSAKSFQDGHLFDMLRMLKGKSNSPKYMKSMQKLTLSSAKHTAQFPGEYDVAIACMELWPTYYVAEKVTVKRKIAWVHTNYREANLSSKCDESIYKKFDNIIAVSKNCAYSFTQMFPSLSSRVVTISNIVDPIRLKEMAQIHIDDMCRKDDELLLLTVARIDNKSKRFDRIVKACRHLTDRGIKLKWFIVGDGRDKDFVLKEANNLGVSDKLILLGTKYNPYPYMKAADLFVLLSDYEGKPIVVTESHIIGCPTVVTEYSGAHEQVPSEYGRVIDNYDSSISSDLYKLLDDRQTLAEWKNNLQNYQYSTFDSIEKFYELCEVSDD